MFNLTNIAVKEFFHLDEEGAEKYVELQTIMNGQPIFLRRMAKELGQLEFGQVAQLKRAMTQPSYENLLESFNIVFGTKKMEYLNADVVSFFYALNWIRENVLALMKREKALIPDPDPDLEMAGVDRLAVFGEMSTLINLGQKFGKAPTDIERWKYNLVFAVLLYNKVHGEVQKKYLELKKPKTYGSKR